jgi:hypothetical protein
MPGAVAATFSRSAVSSVDAVRGGGDTGTVNIAARTAAGK